MTQPTTPWEPLETIWQNDAKTSFGDVIHCGIPLFVFQRLKDGTEEACRVVARAPHGCFLVYWIETGRGGVIHEHLYRAASWRRAGKPGA